MLVEPSPAATSGASARPSGEWAGSLSRFLTDRTEAERAYALAEQLGSVNAAARQRSGQPVTPTLDPVFVALNPHALPARPRLQAELHQWVHRDEEYATLGANVVVELNSEAAPASPPPAPGRSSAAPNAPTATPVTVKAVASAGRPTVPSAATAPADPTNPRNGGWLAMPADRMPPQRALAAGGPLVTHPQGSAPGLVSAGSHLRPAQMM